MSNNNKLPLEGEFSEVKLPLYGVLRSSPCLASGTRLYVLAINTAIE